eukprot:CAMPEP_0167748444 /NCGR_PEP_ID=MMETSP0110_2-20121227/4841_1 /TAXON_ID=629695 /ORGANISM="Gymnochlora sp., Strain CCMP2014" /LENGTH=156 /DNA_ID=CAMNT_0007633459 /DNA_START=589 /DNA_END=1056 /DNA_ORIENTATION=-
MDNPRIIPDASAEGKVTSGITCNELGWNNAKLPNLGVIFADTDGDTNMYKQGANGIESYVKKGKYGVWMREGMVPRLKYIESSSSLDDSYGVMVFPDSDKKGQILSDLAALAHNNKVPGLAQLYTGTSSCRSTIDCNLKPMSKLVASGHCKTLKAR